MRGFLDKKKILFVLFVFAVSFLTSVYPPIIAQATPTTWYANSSAAAGGNGSFASPFNSFHSAYQAASSGDTIDLTGTFDWSTAGETGDTAPDGYTIAKSLTIQGQSASTTFVQAASSAYTAGKRIFTLNTGYTVTIQRITLRYGYKDQDNWSGTAIYSAANLNLLSSNITENANPARFGGAAISYTSSGKFVMRNSTIYNNGKTDGYWPGYTAAVDGGGSDSGNEITNCTFTNNRAGYNGGLYISTGTLNITNSTFVNNYASTTAADLGIWGGRVYVKNNIFADSAGDVNVTVGGGGAITDNGYNIVETQENAGFVNGVNHDLVGNQANLNVSHTLADNNGLYGTQTLLLSTGSVAINAGDIAANNGITPPLTDQRGATRPDTIDIGAFEYGGVLDIAEPTNQASNLSFSTINYNKMTLSWSNGSGASRAVFGKLASSGTAEPADNTTYIADSILGSGSQIGSSGWYCVYNGNGTSVTVTGLIPSSNYTFQVFEYNGNLTNTENYYTAAATDNPKSQATTAVLAPSTQATSVTFSSLGSASTTIGWTAGSGNARAVFVKATSTGIAQPVDSTTYTANAVFGSGTQIGSSGWYCVYSGSGTSITISGLTASTVYRAFVVEYNGDAGNEKYNSNRSTQNPRSQQTKVSSESENFEAGNFGNFSWTMGGTATSKNWTVTSADKNGGTYSAKAGAYHETSKTSFIEVTLNVLANGNISFYKKVSSESGCDYLKFYIDGVQQTGAAWAGTVAWSQSSYAVTAGSRTFRWTYSKDGSVDTGSDTAWIDDIVFPQVNQTMYSLEYEIGDHGTLAGSAYQYVQSGGNGSQVEVTPATGYSFLRWSDILGDNPRTDSAVSGDVFVEAEYQVASFSLHYLAGPPSPSSSLYGTISGSSSQTVEYNSNGSAVTAVANTGYHFVRWSDDLTQNPRTDSNITSDKSVWAVFEVNSYTLLYSAQTGGTIAGSTTQTVSYGSSGSAVTAMPNAGYSFIQWSDGATNNPRIDANVLMDELFFAIFVQNSTQDNSSANMSGSENSTSGSSGSAVALPAQTTNLADQAATILNPNASPALSPTSQIVPKTAEEFFTKAYEKEGQVFLTEIRFRVIDGDGNPLVGVAVTLHSTPIQTITDKNGIAVFKDVPLGDHRVEVVYNGKTISKPVLIAEPEVKNQEIKLQAIEVKVEDKTFPIWIYFLLGVLLILAVHFVTRYLKRKR